MTHVILRNFLGPATSAAFRALARNEALFIPATVTGDASWRSGRVAHIEGRPEAHVVAEAVLKAVPTVCYALRIDAFAPSRCEVQLSSYGDGDLFRAHTDDGSPDAAARVLSWVIYLDLVKPRRWTGGKLSFPIWQHIETGGPGYATDMWIPNDVTPEDGDAIFFPSSTLHEVMPVSTLGDTSWEARRHTINGWVRR